MPNTLNYVSYKTKGEPEERKVLVISGIPFYFSTGTSEDREEILDPAWRQAMWMPMAGVGTEPPDFNKGAKGNSGVFNKLGNLYDKPTRTSFQAELNTMLQSVFQSILAGGDIPLNSLTTLDPFLQSFILKQYQNEGYLRGMDNQLILENFAGQLTRFGTMEAMVISMMISPAAWDQNDLMKAFKDYVLNRYGEKYKPSNSKKLAIAVKAVQEGKSYTPEKIFEIPSKKYNLYLMTEFTEPPAGETRVSEAKIYLNSVDSTSNKLEYVVRGPNGGICVGKNDTLCQGRDCDLVFMSEQELASLTELSPGKLYLTNDGNYRAYKSSTESHSGSLFEGKTIPDSEDLKTQLKNWDDKAPFEGIVKVRDITSRRGHIQTSLDMNTVLLTPVTPGTEQSKITVPHPLTKDFLEKHRDKILIAILNKQHIPFDKKKEDDTIKIAQEMNAWLLKEIKEQKKASEDLAKLNVINKIVAMTAVISLSLFAALGAALVATVVFAPFGVSVLGGVYLAAIIGGGAAIVGAATGFGIAKTLEPKSAPVVDENANDAARSGISNFLKKNTTTPETGGPETTIPLSPAHPLTSSRDNRDEKAKLPPKNETSDPTSKNRGRTKSP